MAELSRQQLLDRRRNKRYSLETCIWLEEQFDAPLIKLNTVNLSASGLLFKSHSEYPVGKNMKVLIELPYFLDLVEAKTTVRHVTPLDEGMFMVGLNVEIMEGMSEGLLKRFLSALSAHQSSDEDSNSSGGDKTD